MLEKPRWSQCARRPRFFPTVADYVATPAILSKGSDPCAPIDSHLQTTCKEECPDKDIAQHSCLVYRRSAKVHIDPPARIDQDEAAEIVAQQEAGLLE